MLTHEEKPKEMKREVQKGMPKSVALFPLVAEAVLGPPPGEVLDKTRGKVGHFYYVCLLVVWGALPFLCITLMLFNPQSMIEEFAVGVLGYGVDDWLLPILALMLSSISLSCILLRMALYPVRKEGIARWRFSREGRVSR